MKTQAEGFNTTWTGRFHGYLDPASGPHLREALFVTTVRDFVSKMADEGRSRDYAATDVPIEGAGLPNNVTVIAPVGDALGRWTVFFTEKGMIDDQQYFASETDACEFVIRRDCCASNVVVVQDSPELRERARFLADQTDARYGEVLRSRGLDVRGDPL